MNTEVLFAFQNGVCEGFNNKCLQGLSLEIKKKMCVYVCINTYTDIHSNIHEET